jgi:transposase-like protein
MNVGKSAMDKWVRQLKEERAGKSPIASPITAEQIEIRELKKRIQRIEMERDRLKKATALLMSDSLNSSHWLRSSGRGFLLRLYATCLGFIAAVINIDDSQRSLMPHAQRRDI